MKDQFSVDITVTETNGQQTILYWNFEDLGPLGRWTGEGIALYTYDSGRVAYFEIPEDATPRIPEGFTPLSYCINEAKRVFNEYILANFDIDPDAEHPLGQDRYEEVVAGMTYNPAISQFTGVQDVPAGSP